MEGPDSANQLSLLPLTGPASARIITLPAPARAANPAGNQPYPTTSPPNPATVTPLRRRPTLWYAAYFPQLAEQTAAQQQTILNTLAGLLHNVSSTVSFHPLALVCEIRSSLNYFGGIDVIHDNLRQSLCQQLAASGLADHFLYAASPTVTGSLLLARSGHNALVYQRDNLRSALGQLPTAVLELDKEQNRRLYNMGVRHLRDIWRLPGDGLRKRFGSDFITLLHKALGKTPEPTRNYLPPPAFTVCYDLPYELEQPDRLLPVADEMLAQLCDFLRRRDLSTSLLLFSILHEKRDNTVIPVGLRNPGRDREHLLMLLETHFANLTIPAPVVGIKLEVKKFDAFMSHSDALLVTGKLTTGYNDTHLDQFIETLQARLGEHRIKSIGSVAEHCPEYACRQLDYTATSKAESRQATAAQTIVSNPRPLWLLPEPLQLTVREGKLYHRKAIAIVTGPERLETYWWSGTDVRRDYYVAREGNGSRLWIYREKAGERNWYLHGFFA